MNAKLDLRRIGIFLGFAFGIAWAVGLIVFLTGGIVGSPEVIPGTAITLAYVLIAFGYMFAPALAHVLTRALTREGWKGALLRPNLRRSWRLYLAAWFLPALLTIAGGLVYFLVFPGHASTAVLDRASASMNGLNPWLFVGLNLLISVIAAPLINSLFTFGEEFGWRAYLLPRLMPLGARRAMLAMGVIWGAWHWPVIAMGHNYGLDYPGAPWLGMLAMVWFTFVAGVFLAWVTLRSGSVWPAVIGHAAINGVGSLMLLFSDTTAVMTLLGPSIAGLLGSLGFAGIALALMLHPSALRPMEETTRPAAASPMDVGLAQG